MSGNTEPVLDLFVVGGGINGTGIANDADGRGLTVGLDDPRGTVSLRPFQQA